LPVMRYARLFVVVFRHQPARFAHGRVRPG